MNKKDRQYCYADFAQMMLDGKIGSGAARSVFKLHLIPDCVAKLEARGGLQNVAEYQVWKAVEKTEFAKWFAPVVSLSKDSTVLIQKKTTPAQRTDFPEKVPVFFTDLKYQNWGLLDGRLVCHDYGVHLLLETGMTKRMVKADWWDLYDC